MANILDYLYWRGDLTLERVGMNPVDALILSWFASMPLSLPLPRTIEEAAEAMLPEVDGERREFLRLMGKSKRFGPMGLERFVEKLDPEEQLQFAAVTIRLGDGRSFAAFRGTDSTLVGWKEDFNMAFMEEVPAQREAVEYIKGIRTPAIFGGHSKGGNLAVYAAVRGNVAPEAVYNFDGPGLSPAVMESPEYRAVEARIETYLPQSSVVGILLERAQRYHVVRSDEVGVMQHDPMSWQVTPGDFVRMDGLNRQSLYADRTIRQWLGSMSLRERENFVETLYDLVESTDADTVAQFSENWQHTGWAMLNAYRDLDLRTRAVLFLSLGKLLRSAVQNLNTK